MFEQRRCQRGAAREDKVRAVLRLDAANAFDDVRSKALERVPFKTFRTVRRDIFSCRIEAVRHRTARRLWPEARPDIVGATAKQQIEAPAIRSEDCLSASWGPIGRGPVAAGEIAVIGGVLDHAVQRDMFHDPDFSHDVSFSTLFTAPAGRRGRHYSDGVFDRKNARTSHAPRPATAPLRAHASASSMSAASSIERPPTCSLVSRYGPSVMSTLPPGCARSDFASLAGCKPRSLNKRSKAVIARDSQVDSRASQRSR